MICFLSFSQRDHRSIARRDWLDRMEEISVVVPDADSATTPIRRSSRPGIVDHEDRSNLPVALLSPGSKWSLQPAQLNSEGSHQKEFRSTDGLSRSPIRSPYGLTRQGKVWDLERPIPSRRTSLHSEMGDAPQNQNRSVHTQVTYDHDEKAQRKPQSSKQVVVEQRRDPGLWFGAAMLVLVGAVFYLLWVLPSITNQVLRLRTGGWLAVDLNSSLSMFEIDRE
jgi:hypothetical protein